MKHRHLWMAVGLSLMGGAAGVQAWTVDHAAWAIGSLIVIGATVGFGGEGGAA